MSFVSSSLVKSFVGFDALFDEINKFSEIKESNYPAYNLERLKDNHYKITIAVVGFSKGNLNVEVLGTLLIVKANSPLKHAETDYLHKGIAQRPFVKKFRLENNIKVYNAELIEGMLYIYLKKIIPEDTLPIKININSK